MHIDITAHNLNLDRADAAARGDRPPRPRQRPRVDAIGNYSVAETEIVFTDGIRSHVAISLNLAPDVSQRLFD